MPRMIFVNSPVNDLAASIRFYQAIGCEKNERFSDDQETSEVLMALSLDSRADVDAITEEAAAAGGEADIREPQDEGFMYGRSFQDLDGHVFEPVWMDVEGATGG